MKFYECKMCGNIIVLFEDKGIIPVCCGKTMEEITVGDKDETREKHVPKITINNNEVTIEIGEIPHPMLEEHYIKWIVLETDKGMYMHRFNSQDKPITKFTICNNEKPLRAYEFCNIHSLWKKDINEK